ncbi:MAG TPA: SMP-30/gluconolactonase/LRE family protein [Pirellulaceae bacterium]|nr:SMP-30/gluconolactonase/LRE family protein [Pirellulaceae bacterium]
MNCRLRPFSPALAVTLIVLASWVAHAADPIPGIGPTGEVKKVHGNLQFTEGPAADREGNLYFSDVQGDKLYKVDAKGELSVLLDPSHHTNGLMCNAAGNIVACEMDGRLIEVNAKTKEVKSLADGYEGKRFNAPNDLVIDRDGGVYFTDPHFRAPMPLPQGVRAFYYRAPDGKVTRLGVVETAPNGIILSPDEKTLYVIPSMQAEMLAYPVEAPGKIGKERVFCTLKQASGKTNGGGDGLTIDTKGNLYITSALGVQVFNPQGNLLGIIEFPEQPANCDFGGKDNKTLYATARTSLYAVPMEAAGHVFPAGKR